MADLSGVKFILFDVGGVLRDASRLVGEGFKRGMAAQGFPFPFEPINVLHFRGLSKYNNPVSAAKGLIAMQRAGTSLSNLLNREDAEQAVDGIIASNARPGDEAAAKAIGDSYVKFFESPEGAQLVGQTKDAERGISLLKEKGYRLGIFTNAAANTVSRDVPYADKFDIVVSEKDVTKKKPSGEGIVVAMGRAQVSNGETAYVGDTGSDIQAARDAGCRAFAVTCGYGLESHLRREGPDAVFRDVMEIAETMPRI